LLGVTSLEPGFREFEVRPYPADLTHAVGTLPTPHGIIQVEWRKTDAGLKVKVRHPAELKCVPATWEECPIREWDIASI
ncbi:MAG: hypothetical protein J5858_09500, partial [Lentisphaeria bacterium]|nr:hypothetical protein [Lentisphaeria bacterium]